MGTIRPEYVAIIDGLWQEYLSKRTPELRDDLVEAYSPLVRAIARKVNATLPAHIDEDDLFMSGVFGLTDAVERYDPDKGVKFPNFAHFRIRGAMIDELRVLDWVPRLVRHRTKDLLRAKEDFVSREHREPTSKELASLLEIPVAQVHELESKSHELEWLRSLDEPVCEEAETLDLKSQLPHDTTDVADRVALNEELDGARLRIAARLDSLPERDQLTLIFYYLYEMTLSEVGEVMGVSESRICQIQTKALNTVRDGLRPTDKSP